MNRDLARAARIVTLDVPGTTSRETMFTALTAISPPHRHPVPPYYVWSQSLASKLRISRIHRSHFLFQNNGTAPHPNPITTRSSTSCTLFSLFYSLGSLSPASPRIFRANYFLIHFVFFFFFYLVQERMPAVVISSPSRLRHFNSFLVQFPLTRYYHCFRWCVPISLFFFFLFYFDVKQELSNYLSPESYVFVPSIRNRTRTRTPSSLSTRRLPR